ncbi:MAG: hypothetical protein A2Y23_03195 [Clostridiales bacterium GWB2_37_7]|nr:MAG: hypothetical protein A2Y23_03195 [Clostridiales bacterium GWB2_37_7]
MLKRSLFFLSLIVILTLVFIGCSSTSTAAIGKEEGYIKLLYPDANVEYWLIEEKKLPLDPKAVVEELIRNKNNMIPKETKLLDIKVENKIAYVNLSKEFETLSNGDTVGWINIHTIVNTLTLNKNLNIDYVQLLLDGKIKQYIWDTITDKPIPPNAELMKMY